MCLIHVLLCTCVSIATIIIFIIHACVVFIAIKVSQSTVICYIDSDDVLFMDTNFTLSVGTRICFDVIIIDDTEIEGNEYHRFDVILQNGTYSEYFNDRTYILIIDNDGECYICMNK